jgi:hypothetical protein
MASTLRITFELDLVDNPPLYQDLVRFPKGPRRVNRLRTLAHAGLITQLVAPAICQAVPTAFVPSQDSCIRDASLELFSPALEGDQ